ncbi:hypothetical protein N7457_006302 [Penicillium paradoxum]|uniref:uncharacterized protein n=1 Tax=Penicillium paradoxum TaxID=176176 RepID=UPI0025493934|nr:uncharacterized protein N7457_006302 [Penicillium paradoxum]KAJ5781142.1 hypothetical protein N7457_006302 [Penicillium paradoxum]
MFVECLPVTIGNQIVQTRLHRFFVRPDDRRFNGEGVKSHAVIRKIRSQRPGGCGMAPIFPYGSAP